MKNYHLLMANFELFNFEELLQEQAEDKSILWVNGQEEGKYAHDFKKGDVVFIYYTNLPDESRRILLKADVLEADSKDDNSYLCKSIYQKNIKGIRLHNIKAVSLEDKEKFSYEKLTQEPYNLSTMRGYRHLEADSKLVKDLEHSSNNSKSGLEEVKDYFNKIRCACKDLDNTINHRSFIKENGFVYYEIHHFIMQNNRYKSKYNLSNEIDKDFNRIILCPICHRKIHYGKIEERRKMIEYIYLKNKDNYDKMLSSIAKGQEFEWIFKQYLSESEKLKIDDYSI